MSTFSYSAKLYESDLQKGEICYEKAKKEHFDALFVLYECSFPDKAPRLPFEYGVINELDTYIALIDGTPVGMVTLVRVLPFKSSRILLPIVIPSQERPAR